MKKVFLVLSVLIFISTMVFAAPAAQSRSGTGGTGGSKLPAGFQASGLPIVTGSTPFTINVYQVRYRSHGAEYMTNSFFTQLEKDTNIKVNWITDYSSATFAEKKALMFASGDVPEVIFGWTQFADSDIMQNLAYFIPLENLINTYMPNLRAAMQEDPDMRKVVNYPDGHIYSLPVRGPSFGGNVDIGLQPHINKTWLDKLNLKEPQTTEELYQVLKAFKERDPNGNGIADEIPWLTIHPSSGFDFDTISFFGVQSDIMISNGKVYYSPLTDKFRQGVEWFAKLYKEGLIDPEYFTMNSDMYYGKAADTSIQRFGFIVDWVPDATLQGNSKDFITIPPPAGPDGKRFSVTSYASASRNSMEITTKCPFPEVVARWADQFYNPDATFQNSYGAFGECTVKEADGSYTLLPLSATPGFDSQDYRMWNRAPKVGPGYISTSFTKYNLDPTSGDGLKAAIGQIALPYGTPDAAFPSAAFATDEQNSELALLSTDLNNYLNAATSEWIAKGGVTDAEWNAFKNQLKAMGAERYTAIKQSIYDNYNR
jgi:putative aldouronate transport system substrate-binding protein